MSTKDQNRAIVTLQKNIDKSKFIDELSDAGFEIFDEKINKS